MCTFSNSTISAEASEAFNACAIRLRRHNSSYGLEIAEKEIRFHRLRRRWTDMDCWRARHVDISDLICFVSSRAFRSYKKLPISNRTSSGTFSNAIFLFGLLFLLLVFLFFSAVLKRREMTHPLILLQKSKGTHHALHTKNGITQIRVRRASRCS